jgi:transposase
VDWEHVCATARPFYRPGGAGRPGVDPAVLVKLALVLAWRGLPSMRAVLKHAATDMAIRRFLGYGLTEKLPDHSPFSHAQTVRFAGSSVFEQLFTAVLRQCTEAGLVGGRRMLVDATHDEADAALKSLRAELGAIGGGGEGVMAPRTFPRKRPSGHGSRWPSRAPDRHRSGPHLTRRRCRGLIQTPSCAASLGIAPTWFIARRSPSTPRRG